MTVRVRFFFLLLNDNVMLKKVTINLKSQTLLPDLQTNNNPELLGLPLSVVCFSHNLRLKGHDNSSKRPRINPRSVHVRYVVDKMVIGWVSSWVLSFSPYQHHSTKPPYSFFSSWQLTASFNNTHLTLLSFHCCKIKNNYCINSSDDNIGCFALR